MIILSDNTATNILIRRIGMEKINARMRELGLKVTALNRLLFDSEAASRGIENYICAKEIGFLLQQMYAGKLVSPQASAEMLRILKNQRLNGKMPFYIRIKWRCPQNRRDDGIIVGIVRTAAVCCLFLLQ